jgi:DNA-binding NarL/FixJ family response regulator
MKPISVLIVDNHKSTRRTLSKLFELDGDIEVVGEAVDGREAVALAEKLEPEIILMDVKMPRMNGVEATRAIKKLCLNSKIIMFSAYDDDGLVAAAIESGAVGYLSKDDPIEDLVRTIMDVGNNECQAG